MGGTAGKIMIEHFDASGRLIPLTWGSLLPSLHATCTTILGQHQGQSTFCSLCQGSDHTNTQCALAGLHEPTTSPLVPASEASTRHRQVHRPYQSP